jgi:hypothetical protein
MVIRFVSDESVLGIRRPYFYDSKNLTERDVGMHCKNLIETIRSYVRKMNIPGGLIDAMISVPADEIEVLTGEKAKQAVHCI